MNTGISIRRSWMANDELRCVQTANAQFDVNINRRGFPGAMSKSKWTTPSSLSYTTSGHDRAICKVGETHRRSCDLGRRVHPAYGDCPPHSAFYERQFGRVSPGPWNDIPGEIAIFFVPKWRQHHQSSGMGTLMNDPGRARPSALLVRRRARDCRTLADPVAVTPQPFAAPRL